MNLENSGDSTGFESMTSAMPVQCSNQLSYEVTQLRAGQYVELRHVETIVIAKPKNSKFLSHASLIEEMTFSFDFNIIGGRK